MLICCVMLGFAMVMSLFIKEDLKRFNADMINKVENNNLVKELDLDKNNKETNNNLVI